MTHEINCLAQAIIHYLDWQKRVLDLKEARRQERFRKVYLNKNRDKVLENKEIL